MNNTLNNRKRKLIDNYAKNYDNIDKYYNYDKLNIAECCEKEKISLAKYYRICKMLNLKSAPNQSKYRAKVDININDIIENRLQKNNNNVSKNIKKRKTKYKKLRGGFQQDDNEINVYKLIKNKKNNNDDTYNFADKIKYIDGMYDKYTADKNNLNE